MSLKPTKSGDKGGRMAMNGINRIKRSESATEQRR